MRYFAILTAAALPLAACGSPSNQGNSPQALEEAAEVSNPAAAQVLENAAENGMDPQNALQAAGNAQAMAMPGGAGDANANGMTDNAVTNGQ